MKDEQELTDEQVDKELAARGITEQMLEAKMTKILDMVGKAKVMKQLDRVAKELGFDLGRHSCPKCGGTMIHTRLKGYVCSSPRCR
jgi:hypothetical protein